MSSTKFLEFLGFNAQIVFLDIISMYHASECNSILGWVIVNAFFHRFYTLIILFAMKTRANINLLLGSHLLSLPVFFAVGVRYLLDGEKCLEVDKAAIMMVVGVKILFEIVMDIRIITRVK